MGFLMASQLDLMQMLGAVCFVIACFTLLLRFDDKHTKWSLFSIELFAFLLLFFDRTVRSFSNDSSILSYYVVRVCFCLIFLLVYIVLIPFNYYIFTLVVDDYSRKSCPRRLMLAQGLINFGIFMVLFSQFTGLYYYFDEMNNYHRSSGYFIFSLIYLITLAIQTSVIITNYNRLNEKVRVSLLLFTFLMIIGSIAQNCVYGVSFNALANGLMAIVLFVVALVDINSNLDDAKTREIEMLKSRAQDTQEFFIQTVEALSGAIDAKDRYTRGHSSRVANYAVEIAKLDGKSEEECNEIYFAAMLHDVGKIGTPDAIINKNGVLSIDEINKVQIHPIVGSQILESITQKPYISIGARYHHERYDGKGYPEHLRGDQIPEMARIIAVADAYDAMTSMRSYRNPIPQQKVREEIFMGMGAQFDPKFAKYMLYLIDMDCDYEMKEKELKGTMDSSSELECKMFKDVVSDGILIAANPTTIRFTVKTDPYEDASMPLFVLFDSLNGSVYRNEKESNDIDYYEFGIIKLNGEIEKTNIRDVKLEIIKENEKADERTVINYVVEAVRIKDHILMRINNEMRQIEMTIALPDSIRYSYLSLTGVNCSISDIVVEKANHYVSDNYIPRIVDEISYIDGPQGIVPNFQCNSWRSEHTEGFYMGNAIRLKFHFMSLPSASRIWHCPTIILFTSDDGLVYGENYREYSVIRFNGESYSRNAECNSDISLVKTVFFDGWEEWKKNNKKGVDCEVIFTRESYGIKTYTECGGLQLTALSKIEHVPDDLMVSISGDNCAISNIHYLREAITEVAYDMNTEKAVKSVSEGKLAK